MSSDQQRDANPRQHYHDLSNEVADILLGPDSPVRGSTEFGELIAEHDRSQSRQAELQALDAKLVEVVPGLEHAEAQLAAAEKQLAAEKKTLAGFAGDLGKAAFAGLRAGELPDNPLFADRKDLQSRIETLQRQRSELSAGENAGMMEKAKIQAQQLKATGQVKVEELKIGSTDRALGTALLTSKERPAIQCDQTDEVLKAIANQRKQVAIVKEKAKQAETAVAGQRSAAAATLGRSTVHDAASLKSELKEVRKEHRENEKKITSIRSSVVATGLETESLREEPIVGEKLKQLWSLRFDLEANKTQGMKMLDESVSRFKGLPPKFKYGAYGVAGVVVLLLPSNPCWMIGIRLIFSYWRPIPLDSCNEAQMNDDIATIRQRLTDIPISKKRPAVPKGIAGLWLCTERRHASHLIAENHKRPINRKRRPISHDGNHDSTGHQNTKRLAFD